ncbi:MAG: ATP-dependent DNA ligase, partial [Candidatus Micrarchaeota archaeon]|nr:ATP-dependent DNA ligase [Candidatus Micrarchaeota archaeon]
EKAISISTGYTVSQVEAVFRKKGDLGSAAEELVERKKQTALSSEPLTVEGVFDSLLKIAKTSGEGSQDKKIKLLSDLLNRASPLEAKYLVRIPLANLQLGVGDPTMMDALSVAVKGDNSLREEIERAYNLSSDLGAVAKNLYEGKKKLGEIRLFNPIRPALAERENDPEAILKRHKTTIADLKLDGFRLQIHKKGNKVMLFSRRLEDMTHSFPDVVEIVKKNVKAEEAIIDSEALAYNESTGEFYPFQYTIQRKRKHGVAEKAEELPLHIFAFDIMYLDGESLIDLPYKERRKRLEKIIKKDGISVMESITTSDVKELEKFFKKSIEMGAEGLVCKDPESVYKAGFRGFNWIKFKRSYKGELADTVDVVIVGYFYGKGARAQFKFGGFLGAVYDEEEDRFKTITRVGSGFSEEMMVKLREILEKIKTKEKPARVDSLIEPDVWVKPTYVVTIKADEITESPMHTAGRKGETGYALRFPRMVGDIRYDKRPEDATTVSEIVRMFKLQKHTAVHSTAES